MNTHDGWKWRLRRRRGWGKRTFSALPGSGHPTGETEAGGASPGCLLLSRSILDGRFRDWKNGGGGHGTKKVATANVATGTLPKMAAAAAREVGLVPQLPSRAGSDDWHPWLPRESPRSRRGR